MEWSLFKVEGGRFPEWAIYTFKVLAFLFIPFAIYFFYRVFKLLSSKCVNCKKKPKLSLIRWYWEILKVNCVPWKEVIVFCQGCRQKVRHEGWNFLKVTEKSK